MSKYIVNIVKYGATFFIAGFVAGLSAIFSISNIVVNFGIVFGVAAIVILPYSFKAQATLSGGKLASKIFVDLLKPLPLVALWLGLIDPVGTYLAGWGIMWGFIAIFMINMVNRNLSRLYHFTNIWKWIAASLLCWLWAYISDKGLRSLWGFSVYDQETAYYGSFA